MVFDTRLKNLTPAPHVVHVTNIRFAHFITEMTSWVDKVQIYFPTFPFTATTSQQQIYFQLKCESQLSDALLLPFGRTFFSEDFKFLNKTHSQPDWKVFWTFFLEDFKFLNTPWRKHTISNTKVILICILLSNSLLRTFCLSDSLNKRRLLSMMHLLGKFWWSWWYNS